MLVLEEQFVINGYTVVNFDATNSLNESDVSPEGPSIKTHYEDLEDVITWAKTQNFYTAPFALAGQSLGAVAVVAYASKNRTDVNLLMPIAFPYINGKEQINYDRRIKDILSSGCFEQLSKSTGRKLKIFNRYYQDLLTWDLSDEIKNITAKTIILIGLLDDPWHIENAKRLYDKLNCEKEIKLLPNVPHDLANTPETKEIFTKTLEEVFMQVNKDFTH